MLLSLRNSASPLKPRSLQYRSRYINQLTRIRLRDEKKSNRDVIRPSLRTQQFPGKQFTAYTLYHIPGTPLKDIGHSAANKFLLTVV